MRKIPSGTLILFLSLLRSDPATPQVRSDYEVTRAFEKETQAIARAVEAATSVVECVDIESRILELERDYQPHKALLDRALYPDGFEGRLVKLIGQITYAKGKITIIESQYDRITGLEASVRELSGKVGKLSAQNSRMLEDLKRLSDSKSLVDSLDALVITLRQGLRERDGLIFALVDSLFLQYDKDMASMTDQEKLGVAARLERRNVFAGIKQAIRDNIRFIEVTSLTGNDISKLIDEQASFASKWKGLGGKLGELYVATKSKRSAEMAEIDTMLVRWESRLRDLFWESLHEVFVQHRIPIEPFSDGDGFYSNLSAYLDEEIRKARDEKDGQRFFRYEAFADSVWYRSIEPNWIPSMIRNKGLSEEKVEDLQDKIDEWEDIVSPPLTIVYIVVGVVMLVVVLYLYRRYVKTREESAEAKT